MVVGFVGDGLCELLVRIMLSMLRFEKCGRALSSSGITCKDLSNAKCRRVSRLDPVLHLSICKSTNVSLLAVAVVVAQNALALGGLSVAFPNREPFLVLCTS